MAKARKVIITCAITGSIHTPSMSPYLPVTPDEIAEAALAAAEAGATVLHRHALDPKDGRPSQDPALFRQFPPRLKQAFDAVFNHTTRGPPGLAGGGPLPPAAPALGAGRGMGRTHRDARAMGIPTGIAVGMLRGDAGRRPVGPPENDRAAHLAARHIERLGRRIDQVIDRLLGEIEGHEFDDRLEPAESGAHAEAGEPMLGDRRVDHPRGPEFRQKPLRNPVGALTLAYLPAPQEDARPWLG